MTQKIILASQSPRRKQLLEWAEVDFEIITQSTDESFPEAMSVEEVPVYIATNKAIAVKNFIANHHQQLSPLPVLAADTVVVLNNQVIGKPVNRNDAINILQSLSGQHHKVITGVVIMNATK